MRTASLPVFSAPLSLWKHFLAYLSLFPYSYLFDFLPDSARTLGPQQHACLSTTARSVSVEAACAARRAPDGASVSSPSHLQESFRHSEHLTAQASLHSMRQPPYPCPRRYHVLWSLPFHAPGTPFPHTLFLSILCHTNQTTSDGPLQSGTTSLLLQMPVATCHQSWRREEGLRKLLSGALALSCYTKSSHRQSQKFVLQIPIISVTKKLQRPWKFFQYGAFNSLLDFLRRDL